MLSPPYPNLSHSPLMTGSTRDSHLLVASRLLTLNPTHRSPTVLSFWPQLLMILLTLPPKVDLTDTNVPPCSFGILLSKPTHRHLRTPHHLQLRVNSWISSPSRSYDQLIYITANIEPNLLTLSPLTFLAAEQRFY